MNKSTVASVLGLLALALVTMVCLALVYSYLTSGHGLHPLAGAAAVIVTGLACLAPIGGKS